MPVTVIRDILRLLALINGRRHEDVSLAALSRLAHRSPFHLHRRFARIVGETPKAYTARVRLTRAAADLLRTDRAASVVAFDHGYASHEVFTRAFTRLFGLTPSAYRARGLSTEDDRAIAAHAATVASVAPCIGLYHLPTTTIEKRNTHVPIDIAVKDLPATHALVMRRRISRDEIATALSECLPRIFAEAQRQGLAITGPPFARYPEIGMGSLVIEGGMPIAAPAPPDATGDGIEALTMPAGPAAVTIHRGPYERLIETYREIEKWLEEHGRTPAGPPWETYLTDPGEHPDPETWETEIVQPIR